MIVLHPVGMHRSVENVTRYIPLHSVRNATTQCLRTHSYGMR